MLISEADFNREMQGLKRREDALRKNESASKAIAAANAQARLEERGKDTAKKIANITDRFSDMPPQVRTVNAALRELDDLADDFSRKKPPNYEAIKKAIDDAKAAIRENGLDQPVNDLLESMQQQLKIGALQAQGKVAEAASLQQILQLERQRGQLSDAQVADIVAANEALRQQTRELEKQPSEAMKASLWHQVKENKIKLVIGTRTALFTPMPRLKLIIVDEEHDASFKQAEGVRFSARDAAIFRAQLNHIPIVLGSATPSLESLHNCQTQKYSKLTLTHNAQNDTPLYYQFVDLRRQPVEDGLALETRQMIEKTLSNHQQVLIFINRRGYAPVLLCHQCGWISDCSACDSHLTLHQHHHLICHHCGRTEKQPTHCPKCSAKELVPVGSGTQRIQQALIQHFPGVPVTRIDRDEIKTKDALLQCLSSIATGEPQIIIGTQMLAKGHHFPNLSLVVILDTDAGLYNQDFRALERMGQLITQVAGRAGREKQPGHIIIQTHVPDHPLLNLLVQKGYQAFIEEILPQRHAANWPPFTHIALIRANGKTMSKLLDGMNHIKARLKQHTLTVLGPAPAPLARKSKEYYVQLLVKTSARKILHQALNELTLALEQIEKTYNIRCSIDIDPISLT